MGHFEPVIYILWHRFIACVRHSAVSHSGDTSRVLENQYTAPDPWLQSTGVVADEIVAQTILVTHLHESMDREEKVSFHVYKSVSFMQLIVLFNIEIVGLIHRLEQSLRTSMIDETKQVI